MSSPHPPCSAKWVGSKTDGWLASWDTSQPESWSAIICAHALNDLGTTEIQVRKARLLCRAKLCCATQRGDRLGNRIIGSLVEDRKCRQVSHTTDCAFAGPIMGNKTSQGTLISDPLRLKAMGFQTWPFNHIRHLYKTAWGDRSWPLSVI